MDFPQVLFSLHDDELHMNPKSPGEVDTGNPGLDDFHTVMFPVQHLVLCTWHLAAPYKAPCNTLIYIWIWEGDKIICKVHVLSHSTHYSTLFALDF